MAISVPELCSQYSVGIPVMESPQLENLWSLENIGISDPPVVDDEALQKFNETI